MLITDEQDVESRHHVIWRAVFYAGLIVGVLFLAVPRGSPWNSIGLPSHAMGRPLFIEDTARVMIITGIVQMIMALCYTFIVAALTYWMRAMPAVFAGAGIGLLLYGINYLIFHFIPIEVPVANEATVALTHIAFCMIAAGAYKGFSAPRARTVERRA